MLTLADHIELTWIVLKRSVFVCVEPVCLQAECGRCGLEQFFEKCMLIVERLDRLGVTREEFLILKVSTDRLVKDWKKDLWHVTPRPW